MCARDLSLSWLLVTSLLVGSSTTCDTGAVCAQGGMLIPISSSPMSSSFDKVATPLQLPSQRVTNDARLEYCRGTFIALTSIFSSVLAEPQGNSASGTVASDFLLDH